MTTQTAEQTRRSWGELGVRSARALRRFGEHTMSAVDGSQARFEAFATQLATDPSDLQRAADRDDMPPAIRNQLLAKGAIELSVDH